MNVTQVNKHLPPPLIARRGPRGHITVKTRIARAGEANLAYHLDKSRFNNAHEAALYAASKIPCSAR